MSSKSSIDKYEPIKLETTILKIDVKTNGDLITKEFDLLPFHPNMADMKDLSNNNYILFPSFVKITMNYLKKAGIGQDYKKAFTNLEKYIKLIKFVTNREKEIDEDFTLLVDQTQYKNYAMSFVQDFTTDITNDFRSVQKYEPLTDQEIITNNIGIIKSIFLPLNGRFFVLGHEYIINECKYLPPYTESKEINEKLSERKKVPLNYTVTIELQLLDVIKNPGMGDFGKLSCKQKQINLRKDVREIFGNTFFGVQPEPKATLPPLTPTTNSKRGFGKLQLEWEERNKYVKAPTTEKERLELEAKWSPLQKKLAQYDKLQEDYNKIPPLWIKERKALDDRYMTYKKDMLDYIEEIKKIRKTNNLPENGSNETEPSFVNDLIEAVKTKMIEAGGELLVADDHNKYFLDIETEREREKNENEAVQDEAYLIKKVIKKRADVILNTMTDKDGNITAPADSSLKTVLENYKQMPDNDLLPKQLVELNEAIKLRNDFLKDANKYLKDGIGMFSENEFYKSQKESIDYKYTEPFLTVMKEREKDVNALMEANKNMNNDIEKLKKENDTYAISGKEQERKKVQANLLKKQADLKVLENRYGKKGEKLIKENWERALDKINTLKKNIEAEKTVGEKTILNESVVKELNSKLSEIKKLKDKLLKAMYFEGDYGELTKEEKDSFSKKPGDKPIESADALKNNIKTLEEEYLDIANKLGFQNKVQGWITLLNEDFSRLKKIRKAKEVEKEEKNSEIKKISAELKNIADAKRRSSKPDEKSEEDVESSREISLKADETKLQKKNKEFTEVVDLIKEVEKKYDAVITGLKKKAKTITKPDDNTIKDSKEEIQKIKTDFQSAISAKNNELEGGGSIKGTRRVRHYRLKYQKKTKRPGRHNKIKKKRSLKKVHRRAERKRKHTRRQRYRRQRRS